MLHDNYGINEKGHLTVCGADTVALADKYGTPLYILDEDHVRAKCREYKKAFEKHFPSGSLPFFASKALSYVGIYRIIADEGLGTDIVSPGELYTAIKAGFPINNSCFHGNNKTDDDIEYGIRAGVGYFVVDGTDADSPEAESLYEEMKRAGKPFITVINKTDIAPHIETEREKFENTVCVSALTGNGMDALVKKIGEYCLSADFGADNGIILNARQNAAVSGAKKALESARVSLDSYTQDIACADIEEAIGCLCELDGKKVSEEIVNEIFSHFCVGK